MLAFLILSIFMGLFILLLGWCIYKYKDVDMLSQLDDTKEYDIDGLSRFAGGNVIAMGLLTIITGAVFLIAASEKYDIWAIVCYLFIILFFSIRVALGVRKFEKK